jgi:hypothetical protein
LDEEIKFGLFLFVCRYGAIRSGYQHFGTQGGQDSGFPSPRSALGYPFPPMHQNSYSGYHLGSYAPPCASPPKDGKFYYRLIVFHHDLIFNLRYITINNWL